MATISGNTDLQKAVTIHGLDEGMAGTDLEDSEDLITDSLAGDGDEKRPVTGRLFERFPVNREAELGGEAEGPQEPQGIPAEGFVGQCRDPPVTDRLASAERIDEPGEIPACESIERQRHGRQCEIPVAEVACNRWAPAGGEVEDDCLVPRTDDDSLGHLVRFIFAQCDSRRTRPFGKTGGDACCLGRKDDIHIGNGAPQEAILDGSSGHVEARFEFEKNMQVR